MNWVVEAIITGTTAFVATNVDDIVILTLFFARAGETLRRRQIVTGQYLGFLGLIVASLPGFLGGIVIPREWLGWLGLLPIAIGIHQLWHQETDEPAIQTISPAQKSSSHPPTWRSFLLSIFHPMTYQACSRHNCQWWG
ncbi:cadmium resistance transporter [Kovacikia minuta]|uniref:cadmium resistance transporter n=1 Tax=Kovacikia minuta TaxID=2931930 RepID=UPI0028F44FE1|nr:cadmium resistance transporter [Kovacikia minuta]